MILIRIVSAKIKDGRRLLEILTEIPMRQDYPGCNCILWLKEAVEALLADGTRWALWKLIGRPFEMRL